MFDSLLAWFSSVQTWLDWLWRECWRQVGQVFTSVWGWGLIAVGWIFTVAKWVGDSVAELAGMIDQVKFPQIPHGAGPMTQAVQLCNTLLPLEELLSFTVAFLALRVALTIYRLVKSWIPTLS